MGTGNGQFNRPCGVAVDSSIHIFVVDNRNHRIQKFSDTSLPVELSVFTASSTADGVLLRWRTESETNNLGFHLYRSTAKNGSYVRITPTLIQGQGNDSTPHDYIFFDETAEVGMAYWYLIEDVDFTGATQRSDPIQIKRRGTLPTQVAQIHRRNALYQNYPNPFNPETWMPFVLSEASNVDIRIYDAIGNQVQTLQLGRKEAGTYQSKAKAAYWDGRNERAELVSSGTYFYELRIGTGSHVRKAVLLK